VNPTEVENREIFCRRDFGDEVKNRRQRAVDLFTRRVSFDVALFLVLDRYLA